MTFDLLEPLLRIAPKIPELIWTLLVGFVAVYVIRALIFQAIRLLRVQRGLKQLLQAITNLILWLFFIVILLQKLGLTNASLALSGSFAFLTVALGAGANVMVADLIAGFHLAKDPDFHLGDEVKVGETVGVITEIGIRKIRLEDHSGKMHILPTAEVDKKEWVVIAKRADKDK